MAPDWLLVIAGIVAVWVVLISIAGERQRFLQYLEACRQASAPPTPAVAPQPRKRPVPAVARKP